MRRRGGEDPVLCSLGTGGKANINVAKAIQVGIDEAQLGEAHCH